MRNRLENWREKIVQTLDFHGRKMRDVMNPGEVFLTNARRGSDEIESDLPMHLHTADELIESYQCRYDAIRIIPTAFDVLGKPLPGYVAIVGVPKKT